MPGIGIRGATVQIYFIGTGLGKQSVIGYLHHTVCLDLIRLDPDTLTVYCC